MGPGPRSADAAQTARVKTDPRAGEARRGPGAKGKRDARARRTLSPDAGAGLSLAGGCCSRGLSNGLVAPGRAFVCEASEVLSLRGPPGHTPSVWRAGHAHGPSRCWAPRWEIRGTARPGRRPLADPRVRPPNIQAPGPLPRRAGWQLRGRDRAGGNGDRGRKAPEGHPWRYAGSGEVVAEGPRGLRGEGGGGEVRAGWGLGAP